MHVGPCGTAGVDATGDMSSEQPTSDEDVAGVVPELTEDDIPGAKLDEPLESHAVHALRRWLLCHGITVPTAWKKAKLIER